MGKLNGQVALITGAASGIGAAVARLFGEQGCALALADKASVPEELAGQEGASVHEVDVTSASDVEGLVSKTLEAHGHIDILVSAAGILDQVDFLDMTPERFDQTLAVDLRGVFLAARYVAPHMVERGSGRIINVASQLAIKGGTGLAHYVAAKAGVVGLTKAIALELAPKGVLVNAVAPGPIVTPLIDGLSDDWKTLKEKELPLGRFGRPEEVAPTALLLASSPDGDLYVGQTLGPNSGDVMP